MEGDQKRVRTLGHERSKSGNAERSRKLARTRQWGWVMVQTLFVFMSELVFALFYHWGWRGL